MTYRKIIPERLQKKVSFMEKFRLSHFLLTVNLNNQKTKFSTKKSSQQK